MALVPITNNLSDVNIPDVRATQVATPVSAGVLGGMADALNHSIGWRQLRAGHWIIGRRHDYANGGVLTEDPSGKSTQTFPLIFTPSPRAEYLQVLITYQCKLLSAISARVSVWIETLAGASVDGSSASPAFLWQTSDGTLQTSEKFVRYVAAATPVYRYPVLHANTSDTIDTSPTTPTPPRCLNISSGAALDLALYVKEQDVRVLTVTVKELYQSMVNQ